MNLSESPIKNRNDLNETKANMSGISGLNLISPVKRKSVSSKTYTESKMVNKLKI